MNDHMVNLVKNLNSVGFVSNGNYAYISGYNENGPIITESVEDSFKTNSSEFLTLVLSAKLAEPSLVNAPYFGVLLGDYTTQKQTITL